MSFVLLGWGVGVGWEEKGGGGGPMAVRGTEAEVSQLSLCNATVCTFIILSVEAYALPVV